MGVASVHPSQRRLSCELCRKAKSRCQRLNWNDPKCARCTMLAVECTTGQQRNPGRPRRTAAHTSRRPTAEQPPVQLNNHPSPPTISRTDTSVWGKGIHLDWVSIMSPAATPAQLSIPAVDDQTDAASTWPTLGINSFDQYSPLWDTDFGHDQTDSFLTPDAGISITMSPQYGLETPPKTVSPADTTSLTSIDTRAIIRPNLTGGFYSLNALFDLSKINLDLHIRIAAAELNKDTLDFNSVIYRQGALYIDNMTLAEFVVKTSQDFLLILTELLSGQPSCGLLCASQRAGTPSPKLLALPSRPQQDGNRNLSSIPSSFTSSGASELLSAPIALTVTSVFIQLVSLFELILEYMTTRVGRIDTDPIVAIPDINFGGLILENPCTQGMLFSEVIVDLLNKIERSLGIAAASDGREVGLLSVRQAQVLWGELDGRRAIIPGHAVMRPAKLRRLFGKLAGVFRQLSLVS
ncbi:hypothetical protein EDB81DRAFT_846970 [Dactylonectria macrodidyma]|uniref:Zn(2)-C6 fungal-type domain-containing protein n=1 Tax=Dactylonectria macrodidyma TaxID=307937 RepID=A0A9P9ILE6_9HYPO|nr:hypothetical protein EDB81DRAFT_846970 [Dactylonectria macrodidyma]